MSVGVTSTVGLPSSSCADGESEQLLLGYIANSNGATRQRLSSSMPLAATCDDSSPSLSPRGDAPAATCLAPASSAGRNSAAAAAAAVSSNDAEADAAASSPATESGSNKENLANVEGDRAGLSCAFSQPIDIITLSDSDDGGDEKEKGESGEDNDCRAERAQRKRKYDVHSADADDDAAAVSTSETRKRLLLVRRRQKELHAEETKLMLLQRLRKNQEIMKAQDVPNRAQILARSAATAPYNGTQALAVPTRPALGGKPAYPPPLTVNVGMKQMTSKEAAGFAGSAYSYQPQQQQVRPAADSAAVRAVADSGSGTRSSPAAVAHGAFAQVRQMPPLAKQAAPVLSARTPTSSPANLSNGTHRAYAAAGTAAVPQRIDHAVALQRISGAVQNGSPGIVPIGPVRPMMPVASTQPTQRAGGPPAVIATPNYMPVRFATTDPATASVLIAERQRAARVNHRKHLERILSQIQPPRPSLRRMDFVPYLPNDSTDGFVYLLGLEQVVKYLTRKSFKEETNDLPKYLICVKCKLDFSPSWRCDRPAGTDVVCDRCVTSRQKHAVRKDYASKLDRALQEIVMRDRELERLLAASTSLALPAMPSLTPSPVSVLPPRGGGGSSRPRAEASDQTPPMAMSKPAARPAVVPPAAAAAAAAAAAHVLVPAASAVANAQASTAFDGFVNSVKKQLADNEARLCFPQGPVPVARHGKRDVMQ